MRKHIVFTLYAVGTFAMMALGAPAWIILTLGCLGAALFFVLFTHPAAKAASPPGYGWKGVMSDISRGLAIGIGFIAAAIALILYLAS